MISAGINLVMSVIGFAVSTMFIVFVCTRLICARIHLRDSRRDFPTVSRFDLSALERGLHGLDSVVVANFPTEEFGDHFVSASGEDTQCTVCLAEYQPKDVLRILPYCRHAFHVTCIDIWLKQHSTCPMCRMSLRGSPDRKSTMQPMYSGAIRNGEPFELDPYQYLHSRQSYPEMSENNQQMESVQDDSFSSEPLGAREVYFPYVEGDSPVKHHGEEEFKGEHMESPSYS